MSTYRPHGPLRLSLLTPPDTAGVDGRHVLGTGATSRQRANRTDPQVTHGRIGGLADEKAEDSGSPSLRDVQPKPTTTTTALLTLRAKLERDAKVVV